MTPLHAARRLALKRAYAWFLGDGVPPRRSAGPRAPLRLRRHLLLHATYDANAQMLGLYLNGRFQGALPTQQAFSLQGVSANLYTGVGGFSVFGDPSLYGSCTQFAFYDVTLTRDQIGYAYATQ